MRDLNDYSAKYCNQPFECIQVHYRKKKVLELLGKLPVNNILEVGCGMDPFFNHFDDFDKLVILEPASLFYENAAMLVSQNKYLNERVVIINETIEDSVNTLCKYDFDYIIISSLLHEIKDTTAFLSSVRQIAKSETVIHLDVPNAYSFHRILAFEMGITESVFEMSARNVKFQQQRIFDLKTLSSLVTESGFEVIDSGSFFLKPFTHKQMDELIKHKIISSAVLEGLYNIVKYMPEMGSEIYIEFKLKT